MVPHPSSGHSYAIIERYNTHNIYQKR